MNNNISNNKIITTAVTITATLNDDFSINRNTMSSQKEHDSLSNKNNINKKYQNVNNKTSISSSTSTSTTTLIMTGATASTISAVTRI